VSKHNLDERRRAETGLPVVGWKFQDRATGAHVVGVSFPQNGMTNVEKMGLLKITTMWLKDHPLLLLTLQGIVMLLSAILYFRITGGTAGAGGFLVTV